MAYRQTRRTVSMSRALHTAATAHVTAKGVSLAGWITSVLTRELATAGVAVPKQPRTRIRPAPGPQHVAPRLVITRPTHAPPATIAALATQSAGTCAICASAAAAGTGGVAPIGRGGALVRVCVRCETEHPRQNGYSFNGSGSASQGVGPGNKRRSSGGAG